MKALTLLFILLTLTARADSARMQAEFPLDSSRVYDIPVTYQDGVTTIIFPGTITSLRAGKIDQSDANNPGASFDVDFPKGQDGFAFFSLRAHNKDAHDVLTVLFEGKAYNLRLTASDGPLYAVRFDRDQTIPGQPDGHRKPVDSARLMSMLDQVKAAPLLTPTHPEAFYDVTSYQFRDSDGKASPLVMHYDGFDCRVIQVTRFDQDDTDVFYLELENFTDKQIAYSPGDIAVRLSGKIYPASIADAPASCSRTIRALLTSPSRVARTAVATTRNRIITGMC